MDKVQKINEKIKEKVILKDEEGRIIEDGV